METALAEVSADQTAHGETVQPAATADAIAELRTSLREMFGAALPDDYAAFLARTNGLDYNGLVIYGAGQSPDAPGPGGFWQGVVAANRLWRQGPGDDALLVIGETDMDLLTVDLDGRNPALRDKVSGDLNERFASVAEAIEECLRRRL